MKKYLLELIFERGDIAFPIYACNDDEAYEKARRWVNLLPTEKILQIRLKEIFDRRLEYVG